ncbi:MAG: hypothetical protein QMD46_12380 [Methanomicrobiales archaeon]|nr:hypothetical protein [Methanomicrobiales archaeon]
MTRSRPLVRPPNWHYADCCRTCVSRSESLLNGAFSCERFDRPTDGAMICDEFEREVS